jgi:hypothetical protein
MSWLSVKLGQLIYNALSNAQKAKNEQTFASLVERPEVAKADPLDIHVDQTQFTVLKVANGRLVKVSSYKPTKSHHSDWTHEVYIVRDDEKVPDVIARIMAIKALES